MGKTKVHNLRNDSILHTYNKMSYIFSKNVIHVLQKCRTFSPKTLNNTLPILGNQWDAFAHTRH